MVETTTSAPRDPESAFRDIENIEQAAGITLPFGWVDVITNALMGPVAAWFCFFAAVLMRDDRVVISLLMILIPLLVMTAIVVALRIWHRRTTGRSATRRREYSLALVSGVVVMALAVPYCVYLFVLGVPLAAVVAQFFFFFGLLCGVLAFTAPGRLYYLGSAVPVMIVGVTLPILASSGSIFNFAPFSMRETVRILLLHNVFLCLAGGFLTAAIMAAQLLLSRKR